jgi:ArsR family transcriptional regulator, arsenate/arsenite/antimonite-responsive transcriptional repressor / arsenate reductase (thioredoxin)
MTGRRARSAGTHPADRVHPGAIAAAERAGLELGAASPRSLDDLRQLPALVVTVCDRAHEELDVPDEWLHWSVRDPVPIGTKAAFDRTVGELRERIATVVTAKEVA